MSNYTGYRLGKYTLVEKIGEGGMATVYRSHHPQFDRPVAIKVMAPDLAHDHGFRTRFTREARTLVRLNHPGIVRIYDMDEQNNLFYMVMDLLSGGTLEQRLLQRSELDRRWSVLLVARVADALDYAHTIGVVHRDVKPSNILLDDRDSPVLTDFGIARMIETENDPTQTSTGVVMGTPAYMAPEQLRGERPDARADIYALGVVLYQLLTGRVPFQGNTSAMITGHLTQPPPHPRNFAPDLPFDLDAVVIQALDKDPYNRFRSAGVFARALHHALDSLEPGMVQVVSANSANPAPHKERARAVGVSSPAVAAARPAEQTAQPPSASQHQAAPGPLILAALAVLVLLLWTLNRTTGFTFLLILLGGGLLFFYLRSRHQSKAAAGQMPTAGTTVTSSFPTIPANQPPIVPLSSVAQEQLRGDAMYTHLAAPSEPPALSPTLHADSPTEARSSATNGALTSAPPQTNEAVLAHEPAPKTTAAQLPAKDSTTTTQDEQEDATTENSAADDEEAAQAEEELAVREVNGAAEEGLAAREVNSAADNMALALGADAPVAAPPPVPPPEPTPEPDADPSEDTASADDEEASEADSSEGTEADGGQSAGR